MDSTKNYYTTLSVSDDSDIEVIKAAYRALCKKYHPDKKNYQQEESIARMQAINEAYEILSNDSTRREYDLKRAKTTYSGGKEEHENFESDVHIEEAWQLATEYKKELVRYYKELAKLNQRLANTFKITLIEKKCFDAAESVAHQFEKDYLNRYFGNSRDLQDFAKKLIHLKYVDAAKELNKIINVFGDNLDAKQIIIKVSDKYNYPPSSSTDQTTYPVRQNKQNNTHINFPGYERQHLPKKQHEVMSTKMVCVVSLCISFLLFFVLATFNIQDSSKAHLTEQQVNSLELQAVNTNDTLLDNRGWVLALGKFRHQKNVRDLMNLLEKSGYRSFSQTAITSSGTITEVFIGLDLRKSNLENALPHLKELTDLHGRVTPFRVE